MDGKENKGYLVCRHDAMGYADRAIKRFSDFCLATFGVIILSPLMLFIFLLLKAQRNGPAIFSQERIGKDAIPFTIYKFRTMKGNIEDDKPLLNPTPDSESSTKFEVFLRNHHLDELPQLWNVIKGDMSIVGPRPERKFFIDKIMEKDNDYNLIYEMRPGMTSEATLYNGYTDSMDKMLKRLRIDVHYLENRTLLLDMKIMWDTAMYIIKRKTY
ncbi:sugar transferase [Xylanibacter oryzae]|uniref:sugar transferase n=1 Tax=Xylanibacter oryzae TaxID=185293 RepID=UPI0004B215B1